jgi:hypothetical protein
MSPVPSVRHVPGLYPDSTVPPPQGVVGEKEHFVSEAVAVETNVEVNQELTTQPRPEQKSASKPIVAICAHIKDDGIRCGTPAVNRRNFCYYHCRVHHPGARIATRRYRAPVPDSVASLQVALAHTLRALATGDLSPKAANSMMYGINLATNLLRLAKPLTEAEQQQVVTEIPAEMEEVLVEPEEPAAEPSAEVPPDRTQAMQVLEKEIRKLRSYVLSPDELQRYQHDLAAFKGSSDPRYYTAVNRIYEHDYGTRKLHEMGVA